jgi:Lrp/AsnC family transcriptional regulator for asnA, asnC and gidA
MAHHDLDELDEKILKMIVDNARIPFLEVARACNVSGAAIHQRVQKLTNLGVIKGSEYIIEAGRAPDTQCKTSRRERYAWLN